jgi:hypothetical protein
MAQRCVEVSVCIEYRLSAKYILHGTAQRQAENKIQSEIWVPEVPMVHRNSQMENKTAESVEKR